MPQPVDEVGKIYTPLRTALREIEERKRNPALLDKVRAFFGELAPPKEFGEKPRAVLVRYIMSPTFEYSYFLDLCHDIRIDPLFLEFSNDKFVARNQEKYSLCKLSFFSTDDAGGKLVESRIRIVDFNKYEGKPLNEIRTIHGEKLVDFHHKLLERSGEYIPGSVVDFSTWFRKSTAKSKEYYYLYYLALFLAHGILFENFLQNKAEISFTMGKVVPAFHKLVELFGIRPLIVPLAPREAGEAEHWEHYDKRLKPLIEGL